MCLLPPMWATTRRHLLFLQQRFDNPPLTRSKTVSMRHGVYIYGNSASQQHFKSSNYWSMSCSPHDEQQDIWPPLQRRLWRRIWATSVELGVKFAPT